ncbi:F-box/LRR-repeat protein 4 [Cryptotermes secundus]|uniref:F-box/LRR-repeat protein 4 n=2 Tax=Cryptotermes secundus TaxID=105785 RepID=A0A2J7PBM0_9NEOP|nr:F-box/LRR-repeat protein 4 isoform X2 [Cryptotermes secundus]PNF13730.1 F-box/LRR-repeat protein 4 [Cryptotermes secundus]PNF13734.1 F-box/LRR-repeat protein 4 [Cryptotermes secundus]
MVDDDKLLLFDVSNSDDTDIVFIEQFVQSVIGFSSQYGSDVSISYTAYNIIGKPSKFPDYGDFPQAFVMRTYGKWWNEAPSRTLPFMPQSLGKIISQDFIDLLFEEAVYPFRVSVYETYNPGSVVRIWAADHENHWRLLWEGEPQKVDHTPMIFSPVIETINSPTRLLRLEFDHSHLEYYTELDAVLLVGTKEPIVNAETHQVPSHDLIVPPVGKLTSQILQHNIHNIPPQIDIPNSIVNFLEEELPQLLKGTGEVGQVLSTFNKVTLSTGAESFDILPDETVLKIFGYLSLLSLCRCAQVSRRFHDLATDSQLYTELNLKVYWYCVTATALRSVSKQCLYLQKLDLSWCGDFNHIISEDFIDFIEECGGHLTHLRLNCCKFADNYCAMKVAEKCKNLKELCLRSCHNITELGFQSLASLKNLQYLDLYRTFIDLGPLKAILKSSPQLKHINMGSCGHISNMDDVAQTLAAYNKELVSVDFWKTYSLTPVGVKALHKCQKLEEVDLGWCGGVGAPGDSFRSLATGCPCLRKLFLAALRSITDRDLEPFIEHCPALEQVDLMGGHSITSDICVKFLTRCNKLRLLDVSFCDQVQDSEVAYWRMVFPHVSVKRSFQHDILS